VARRYYICTLGVIGTFGIEDVLGLGSLPLMV
jgi:hypothetical protein